MNRTSIRLALISIWVCGLAASAVAQTPPAVTVATDGPSPQVPSTPGALSQEEGITVRATRLTQPFVLDGLLDEDVYRTVPATGGFIQSDPRPGQPATEATEVWVFFDEKQVYVSLRCIDSQPDRMVANEMRRDNVNIYFNDNVIVLLDTFYDRRSAYFFQTNPLGGVREALVISESVTNYDWNTVWDVKSRRSEQGWTTEMAIPFKSLRYPAERSQKWGFNVLRNVRAKNEQSLLSPAPLSAGGGGFFKLAYAATLEGIEAPPAARNVEVKPYGISSVTTNVAAGESNDPDGALGVDAKYGITSSLTLDFTYNTDFAQVEIDEQQINLTRFSLFFPEKRDFFLEGQGVFDFAGSGASLLTQLATQGDTPVMFFSRRIGLSEQGRPVAINAGARLTGRVGRTSVGILNIQTEDNLSAGAVATNFSVVRVKRDILRKSNVGLLVTHRTPSLSVKGSNQLYGVDANLAFFTNLRINSYYSRSSRTDRGGDAESYRGQFLYSADRYGFDAERVKVGNAFNPEIGFVRRRDFHRTFAHARFSPRPRAMRGIRKLGWEGSLDRYSNSADVLETRHERGTFRVDFNSGDAFTVNYIRNLEFLARPFQVARGVVIPTGEHHFDEVQVQYSLGPQRVVSGTVNVVSGGYYTGNRTEVGYNGRIKMNYRLAVEPRVSINWVDLPQGRFRPTLVSARPTFTITPRMFASAFVQYNSSTSSVETNARLRWEYTPGSDLFVVYTDGRDTTNPGFPELLNRSLAVKFTRLFRF